MGGEAQQWIAQNHERFGLRRPMSWEPWHFEPDRARSVVSETIQPAFRDVAGNVQRDFNGVFGDLSESFSGQMKNAMGALGTGGGSGAGGGLFGWLFGGQGTGSGLTIPESLYSSGGYTGHGGKYDPAGIVHRGEFVINRDATSRHFGLLSAINNGGLPGYANGGYVAPVMPQVSGGNIFITNNAPVQVEAYRDANGDAYIKIVDERVAESERRLRSQMPGIAVQAVSQANRDRVFNAA